MAGPLGDNSLYLSLKYRDRGIQDIPFVDVMNVSILAPDTIKITVYEKALAGYVKYLDTYMYFDKDGIVVESANRELSGVPRITGLKFGHIALYQKLPVESEQIFEEILNLTQILSIYGLEVDRIQYNSFGEANLYMGNVEVVLGSNESLNGKIAELCDMLPKLEGLSGTLYLDTYDETGTGGMYAFKPAP